jgi:hypothetical protein
MSNIFARKNELDINTKIKSNSNNSMLNTDKSLSNVLKHISNTESDNNTDNMNNTNNNLSHKLRGGTNISSNKYNKSDTYKFGNSNQIGQNKIRNIKSTILPDVLATETIESMLSKIENRFQNMTETETGTETRTETEYYNPNQNGGEYNFNEVDMEYADESDMNYSDASSIESNIESSENNKPIITEIDNLIDKLSS